jgi:glycosyltransferase involved in cell wall biosynthesis
MPTSRSIAFVCPRLAESGNVGGAETLLRNLAERLVQAGRSVTFLTTCARNHFTWANDLPPGEREINGMKVILFPVDEHRDLEKFLTAQGAISRGMKVSRQEEQDWLKHNVNSTALCQYLASHTETFDRIIMGPYLFGLIYHAAQVCPDKTLLVPCLHDEAFAYLDSFREMFGNTRGCMFNSEPERDLAIRLFGMANREVSVVGMGLDPFEANPDTFRTQRRIERPYLLYSGRRELMKGTPLLIDYFTSFRARTGRDLDLVLTGSGEVHWPGEVNGHVHDVGFLSEPDKRDAMAGALAFCHPSVNESLGIVLLESWLARTPALVHARSEVLKHQCRKSNAGLWFRSYPEFEEAVEFLLENPQVRARMGTSGRNFVMEEYAWPKVEKRMLDALDR